MVVVVDGQAWAGGDDASAQPMIGSVGVVLVPGGSSGKLETSNVVKRVHAAFVRAEIRPTWDVPACTDRV